MKVGELIARLQEFPNDWDICFDDTCLRDGCKQYYHTEIAEVRAYPNELSKIARLIGSSQIQIEQI